MIIIYVLKLKFLLNHVSNSGKGQYFFHEKGALSFLLSV